MHVLCVWECTCVEESVQHFGPLAPHTPNLQSLKPTKVKDASSGRFVNDYWETSKKMLSDISFLESLKAYDKVRQWQRSKGTALCR